MLKLSIFLKQKISPFLLGAFLSRVMVGQKDGKKVLYTYSYYKKSEFVQNNDFLDLIPRYVQKLNQLSQVENWVSAKNNGNYCRIIFCLENNLNMSVTNFFSEIYKRIMSFPWKETVNIDDDRKKFIRGYFELRGSIDTTAAYLAQDYMYQNAFELQKAKILFFKMNIPFQSLNINPRNLQNQFVTGECKRNTQFRINLYFYAKNIGFIGEYKSSIFKECYYRTCGHENVVNGIHYFNCQVPKQKFGTNKFFDMLNYFTNYIYEKELTTEKIKKLRSELGFDKQTESKRNQTIIDIFREISPDKCASCGTTKTYTNPKTGRQQFEIHHMISLCNDFALDKTPNLVKLCPTCHRALKKNGALKTEQINIIKNILSSQPQVLEFTRIYLGINEINSLAEAIQQRLG